MNLYFLVEGKRTETRVYPAWLAHLVPKLARVNRVDDIKEWNYFLFSGHGYPSLLDVHLKNAIDDFHLLDCFNYFCICLDVDDSDVPTRVHEVQSRATSYGLDSGKLIVIPQDCCIESWLLGNRKVVSTNPQLPELASYLKHYDVRTEDPELMPPMAHFRTKSAFHFKYMRLVAQDKGLVYSKHRPGHVCDKSYVEQLSLRTTETGHLKTLRAFFDFCAMVRSG